MSHRPENYSPVTWNLYYMRAGKNFYLLRGLRYETRAVAQVYK